MKRVFFLFFSLFPFDEELLQTEVNSARETCPHEYFLGAGTGFRPVKRGLYSSGRSRLRWDGCGWLQEVKSSARRLDGCPDDERAARALLGSRWPSAEQPAGRGSTKFQSQGKRERHRFGGRFFSRVYEQFAFFLNFSCVL